MVQLTKMVAISLNYAKNLFKDLIQEMKLRPYLILALAFIISFQVYLEIGGLHSTPFISDEGFIVYATRAIFAGENPYKQIFLNQPLIMYFYYGSFMQLFGWNIYTARIAVIVLLTFNTILIFLLAKTLLQRYRFANIYALACSAIFALYPSYYGAGMHTTGFVIEEPLLTSFYLISTIFYVKFMNQKTANSNSRWLFVSGFFAGCALMTKMTGALFVAALFFFHLISRVFSKKAGMLKKEILYFVIGAIVVPLFFMLFLYLTGGLTNFFQHVIFKNLYQQELGDAFARAETMVYFRTFMPMLPALLIGTFYLASEARSKGAVLFFPVWLYFTNLFSFVFLIKSTTTKYFIALFPFHYLIAVFGFSMIAVSLWRIVTNKHTSQLNFKVESIVSLIVILIFMIALLANPLGMLMGRTERFSQYQDSLSLTPVLGEEEHTLINYEVGKYVESITKSNDRIWTSEGAIAFFANRLIIPPVSSSYPYQAFWADQLVFVELEDFIDAWETDKTKSIVLIRGPVKIGEFTFPYPDETMWNDKAIQEYIETNYILINTLPFQSASFQVWVRATDNLIANPSLEEGSNTSNNWEPFTWSGMASFDWNHETSRSGKFSIEINTPLETNSAWASFPKNRVNTDKFYNAKVYLKTENLTGSAFVSLSWFDESGAWISTTSSSGVSGTTDWALIDVSGFPPAQAVEVNVELHLAGSGRVWFDDISLQTGIY